MRRIIVGLLMGALVATYGCLRDYDGNDVLVVACIGDSNTYQGWPYPDGQPRWCQYLPTSALSAPGPIERPIEMRGTTDSPYDYTFSACAVSAYGDAVTKATELLAAGDIDAVMFALGTNDLGSGVSPAEIVACLSEAVAVVESNGARALVATVPPSFFTDSTSARIEQTNELIRATFRPHDVIDFDTGFNDPSLYVDQIHLNDTGQHMRAQRAVAQW